MEQHPIPQQISSYQFRLVGDMTLKQFFQLAGGFVVALIFYSAPIIGIIKWPFVIVSGILGVALAFLPLEERPLEKWIFAFFRAIYAPTEFFWKKTSVAAKFYQDEPAAETPSSPQQTAINQYLSTPAQGTSSTTKLETAEKGFLSSLTGVISGLVTQATGGPIQKPALQVPAPTLPTETTPPSPVAIDTAIPVGTVPLEIPKEEPIQEVSAREEKTGIEIPQTPLIKVEPSSPSKVVVEEKAPTVPITTHQVAPTIAGEEIVSTKQAIFSIEATPPNPPTVPNVVVGQVVDQDRRIIEGAIMEVRDSAGHPIRALRSNRVGHFITVTPLEDGRYDVITEKDGYEFAPLNFEAAGQIIPPILIQGHKIESGISNVESGTDSNLSGQTLQTNVSTY